MKETHIANMTQDIADFDHDSDFDLHRTGPHMRIQDVTIRRDFDDDVIACGVLQVDRDGTGLTL